MILAPKLMADESNHTFLFADLAGFTALTEAHGDEEAAELAGEFCDCVRGLLPEHGGQEIKTIGDAMMIRSEEAAPAVMLGLRIVDDIGDRPQFPIVRVGMHTGPAIERSGDWFGAAVNLAARVSSLAGGDEVLLTDATREAAEQLDGVELRRHGEQRFKNVRDPVVVHRALREGRVIEERLIDPVCRMAVDPDEAAGKLNHAGREYLFCSLRCVRAFAAEPESFSEALSQEPSA